MRPIKTARYSEFADRIFALRATRVLLAMEALLLICSVGCSFAQIDASHLIDRSSSSPQTVSRNQLLAPRKAWRAIERAHKDIVDGHLESAEKEIALALDIAPHFAVAKALQGAIDLETENYEEGRNYFQQAIDDDPALGGAYVGMAVVLIHQGRFQSALLLLNRAEGLLSGAWLVHFAKGCAQLELGDTDAALKQADSAERIAGTDSEEKSGTSYLRAMVSIHKNDIDAAKEYLAEAVARNRGGQYAVLANREIDRLQPSLTARR